MAAATVATCALALGRAGLREASLPVSEASPTPVVLALCLPDAAPPELRPFRIRDAVPFVRPEDLSLEIALVGSSEVARNEELDLRITVRNGGDAPALLMREVENRGFARWEWVFVEDAGVKVSQRWPSWCGTCARRGTVSAWSSFFWLASVASEEHLERVSPCYWLQGKRRSGKLGLSLRYSFERGRDELHNQWGHSCSRDEFYGDDPAAASFLSRAVPGTWTSNVVPVVVRERAP